MEEEEEEVFRVAVVGGGLAGISAARLLSSQFGKESVVLLEAASCLGGRIQNVPGLAPWPVEIGPEFLHGSKSSSVKEIADEMGCALRELNFPDYYYIGHERKLLSSKEADEHPDIQLVHEIFEALSEEDSTLPDMSMAEYLRLKGVNHTVMQLAQAIYGNDFGCALDRLGVHECILEARQWIYGDKYLILDRPLSSVVDYMSKDLSVRLNWVVSKVVQCGNNTLELHSQDGRVVKSDYLILTVPVTILQQGLICFNPALPDWKIQAAHAIGMSTVVKVLFTFCHPFWPKGLFDVVCSECFLPEVWVTEYPVSESTYIEKAAAAAAAVGCPQDPLGQYVVVGFIAGEAANASGQLPEAEIFIRGLAQLDAMFGKNESPSSHSAQEASHSEENVLYKQQKGSEVFFTKGDLLQYAPQVSNPPSCHTNPASFHFQGGKIVNWADQRFIRGGYSHPSVNAQGAREALAKPVNRMYFAGEATHPGVNPCLQAAIDTGQRAAYQVMGACKSHSRL